MLPTIDFLKENHRMIHWFGLGFIQIKMKEPRLRYHFYTTKFSPTVGDGEYHNHRYYFTSNVLKGHIRQELIKFELNENGLYVKHSVSCDRKKEAPYDRRVGNMLVSMIGEFPAGSSYYIFPNAFHKIICNQDTITKLHLSTKCEEFAEVIRSCKGKMVCPFSENKPESELWEIVEDMLK